MDEAAFTAAVERHRREIGVHCYRMIGSFEESEDLAQETFLRAWKARGGFEGRASLRTWLYRIATNVCLDALARRPRRLLPDQTGPAADPGGAMAEMDAPWLEPYPDRLLDEVGRDDTGAAVIERETIELAFLAAIQYLPPRQRAALILRDVLDWSARDTAGLLETSVASANSALQRARATLRERLPARRAEWAQTGEPTADDLALLRRFVDAYEHADPQAVASLLSEDAKAVMPPYALWFDSRDRIVAALSASLAVGAPWFVGRMRMVPVRANRQLAVATYRQQSGDDVFRPFGVSLLTVANGRIRTIAAFERTSLAPYGLPETWPPVPVSGS